MTDLLGDLLLSLVRNLKLHAPQLRLDLASRISDLVPRVALCDGLLRLVVEAHHGLHHPISLPHRAVLVVVGVTILLEKVFLDQCGDIKSDLVAVTERRLSDQLDNLIELFGSGEQLPNAVTQTRVFWVVLLVVTLECGGVLAV